MRDCFTLPATIVVDGNDPEASDAVRTNTVPLKFTSMAKEVLTLRSMLTSSARDNAADDGALTAEPAATTRPAYPSFSAHAKVAELCVADCVRAQAAPAEQDEATYALASDGSTTSSNTRAGLDNVLTETDTVKESPEFFGSSGDP